MKSSRRDLAALWLLPAAAMLTGCAGSADAAAPASTSTPSPVTTTVTSTATTTKSVTSTKTSTVTKTRTATTTITSEPTSTQLETSADLETETEEDPALEDDASDDDFDAEWTKDLGGRIVRDVKTIDKRLNDGVDVGMAYDNLARSFQTLAEDAGVPPGQDSATYISRLTTMQTFIEDASDLEYDQPMTSVAKYYVVREKIPTVLTSINTATGSDLSIPAS